MFKIWAISSLVERLLLIDLGFYKHNTFARIDENGGFFVSRLKGKVDPLIIRNNCTCRRRSIDIVGKKVSEVIDDLQSQALDPNVNRKRLMDEWRT